MRIHRLRSINDFRIFKNWTDTESERPHSFAKQTIVLGANGSGKSTLTDIAWLIERRQAGEPVDPRLKDVQIELTDGSKTSRCSADGGSVPLLRVFGKRYVETNLFQAFERGEQGAALYVVGEPDIKLEKRIADLEGKQADAGNQVADSEEKSQSANDAHRKLLDTVKQYVVELLVNFDPKTYNPTKFNVAKAEGLLKSGGILLPTDEFQKAQSELNESPETIPANVQLSLPKFDSQLIAMAEEVASFSVTSQVIESLANDPDTAGWVNQGLPLHKDKTECSFCGASLKPERLSELDAHFDKSHKLLMARINQLSNAVDSVEAKLDEVLTSQLAAADQRAELRAILDERKAGTDDYWATAGQCLEAIRQLVELRKSSPHQKPSWTAPSLPNAEVWGTVQSKIVEINDELANRRASISQTRHAAAKRLLSHVAGKHADDYATAEKARNTAKECLEKANLEFRDASSQLEESIGKRKSAHDGEKLATALTNDLANYLGHRELTVRFVNAG